MEWKDLVPKDYVFDLTVNEISAINAAVLIFKNLNVPAESVDPENFPLPEALASRLANIGSSLYNGRGIAVLRGLDPSIYNEFDKAIVFAGVSSYVCSQRGTDDFAGVTMGHIRDATHDRVPDVARDVGLAGFKLPDALSLHADRFAGDILALFVVDQGADREAGSQFVSSFWHIYEELLVSAPDVIKTLEANTWPWEVVNPVTHEPDVNYAPALFYAGHKPIIQLVLAVLVGAPQLPRSANLPTLSPEHYHAIQRVQEVAQKSSHQLDREDGDIQFINNLGIMHARSAYGGKEKSSRLLLRMFLRDPRNAWVCDGNYKDDLDRVFTTNTPQEFVVRDHDPWFKIHGMFNHG